MVILLVLILGCGRARHKVGDTPSPPPKPPTVARAKAIEVTDLRGLSCTDGVCTLVTGAGSQVIDPVTLERGELVIGAPPEATKVTLSEGRRDIGARWNRQISAGWRSPFQEYVPTPTNGRLSYMRSLQSDSARLMRIGGKLRAQPAPHAKSPVAYRRWLALHPSGQQAYLAPWPHTEIIAVDPDRLLTGWRLDLEAPTLGLFVDATGQYLVGETGGSTDLDRLLDFSGDPIAVPDGVDPAGDPHLAEIPRPVSTHTVVIYLTQQTLVARLPGTYMRWVPVKGHVLIATTKAVGRLPLD